ncbi:MAG TPA: FMN-binding negative transcriptional regulator [Caldimonas sp.]|jgi:transcriptional regulator|nr:FMN-binding negative transcriptional regulator [Caldimonas sp.]HEX4234101.1 FMN-binding negative transcriptional regulator [Caldimonas sp.]
MYLPAHFSEARPAVLRAFVRDHPLGLLVTQTRSGDIDANSVPFILDAEGDAPGVLRAHVARANPVWTTARDDVDALVVFQGPHGYVSPAWYPSKAEHGKVVPTWNYLMVQARGRLRAIDDRAWLREFVTRLTDRHESGRTAPWAVGDAPGDFIDTMLGAIVGIELTLSSLVGKWKVSQNRGDADRKGVVEGLVRERGDTALAAEVRTPGGG